MDIISAAISHFEYGISHDIFKEPVTSYARAAVSALRAQREQQPNTPLTLDELRQMDGEPVWWWNTSAKPVCTICVFHRFLSEPLFANYDFMSEDTVKLTKYKWLKKCGYKPYRRKPEEGQR